MSESLRFMIRTPHESILDGNVQSVRIPTETGQVGLRPRQEPLLLAVEPGLLLLRSDSAPRFAATAGGLLRCDRRQCLLYTPFAVLGDDEAEVLAALSRALATPDSELLARRQLGELEHRIVEELGRRPKVPRARNNHA